MSNRRKLTPPRTVRRYAKTARCTDCDSETDKPWLDEHGMWHVSMRHDAWCPVLNGHVSAGTDTRGRGEVSVNRARKVRSPTAP